MPTLHVNAAPVTLAGFDPNESLLDFLRERLRLPGTKEGCASGDCGACTVVVQGPAAGIASEQAGPRYDTVNSCITPLGAMLDHHVVTVEGVGTPDALHPVQAALVEHHGSQCGFCTPGFVMALVGHQLAHGRGETLARSERGTLVQAIGGNLCRCTGYRPILDAAADADRRTAAAHPDDAARAVPSLREPATPRAPVVLAGDNGRGAYHRPRSEAELQALLAALPADAPWDFVAGATDLWLEVTQRDRDLGTLIDLGAVAELRAIERVDGRLRIGAGVAHCDLATLFGADGALSAPDVVAMLARFGSPQIRHRGTLGGNIANASPIADWPPVLLCLDADVELADAGGGRRSVPLAEFYTGYRATRLRRGEYLRAVTIDAGGDGRTLHVHKITKRFDDDISAVLGAFRLPLHDGRLTAVRVAYGGMAATPVRLPRVEALLEGRAPDAATADAAIAALERELAPIGDVRASARYRLAMAVTVLRKALHTAATGEDRRLEAIAS